MKKSSKKIAGAPASQDSQTLKSGEMIVGPGVIKRQRREQSETSSIDGQDLKYTPSDQVFRRR